MLLYQLDLSSCLLKHDCIFLVAVPTLPTPVPPSSVLMVQIGRNVWVEDLYLGIWQAINNFK